MERFVRPPLVFTTDAFEVAVEGAETASALDSGGGDSGSSAGALLAYFGPLAFTLQPVDQVGVIGGDVSYHVTVNNGGGVLFYWQFTYDNVTWYDLPESTGFSEGVGTSTLHLKNLDNTMVSPSSSDFRVRCRVANGLVAITSHSAKLTIPYYCRLSGNVFDVPGEDYVFAQTSSVGGYPKTTLPVTSGQQNFARTGGTAPFTYHWTRVSGSTQILCSNANIQNPEFSMTFAANGYDFAWWVCELTDSLGAKVKTNPLLVIMATSQSLGTGTTVTQPQSAPAFSTQRTGASSFQVTGGDAPFTYEILDLGSVYPRMNVNFTYFVIDQPTVRTTTFVATTPLVPGYILKGYFLGRVTSSLGNQKCFAFREPISPAVREAWQWSVPGALVSYR